MAEFLMYLTNGIAIGVINAISAIGVSLIVGIMKVVNFAHGEMYIFAGYFSYHLSTSLGLHPRPFHDRSGRFCLSLRTLDGAHAHPPHLRG